MKQFLVSLNVRSRTLEPDAIGRLLGCAAHGAHRRGDRSPGPGGDRSFIDHLWWVGSAAGDAATIDDHAASLAARLDAATPEILDPRTAGLLEISIAVGIMYDTYTTSVRLPRQLIALAGRLGATIEVSSYPTDFAEEQEADAPCKVRPGS